MAWTAKFIRYDVDSNAAQVEFTDGTAIILRTLHAPAGITSSSEGSTWLKDQAREIIKLLTTQDVFPTLAPNSDITPPAIIPPVSTFGSYRAATSLINGAATAQNLVSIENPITAIAPITVTQIKISGAVVAIAKTQFLYHVGRTTELPSGGTSLTEQKDDSNYPAAVAIVRQAPTATAAAGDLWTGQASLLVTAAGQNIASVLEFAAGTVLAPGEGLIVRADGNTTGWQHSVTLGWTSA